MKLILRVLLLGAGICTSYALCNTCSAISNVACVSNDQFKVCIDGLPSTDVYSCPNGTICTASAQICSPSGTVQPSCARCGVCNGSKIFACTSYNTFALCFASDTHSNVNITCPGTTVCNIDSPYVCVEPTITGIGGTCPSATATPNQSNNPATNPTAYCIKVAAHGRHEIPSDPNCKSYVFCSLVNSTWVGNVYECPGMTFFNATSRLCGTETPARCA